MTQSSRNNSSVSVSLCSTSDREGLSRSCLSISENSSVIAFKAFVYNVLSDCIKNTLLLSEHVEDAVELEAIEIIFDLSVPQTLFLEREFH
jgi:hypothetical protein